MVAVTILNLSLVLVLLLNLRRLRALVQLLLHLLGPDALLMTFLLYLIVLETKL